LSLPVTILVGFLLEFNTIFLDVGAAEAAVPGEVACLREDGGVLWIHVALSVGRSHEEGDKGEQ